MFWCSWSPSTFIVLKRAAQTFHWKSPFVFCGRKCNFIRSLSSWNICTKYLLYTDFNCHSLLTESVLTVVYIYGHHPTFARCFGVSESGHRTMKEVNEFSFKREHGRVHSGSCGHIGMRAVISEAIFPSLSLKDASYWNSSLHHSSYISMNTASKLTIT